MWGPANGAGGSRASSETSARPAHGLQQQREVFWGGSVPVAGSSACERDFQHLDVLESLSVGVIPCYLTNLLKSRMGRAAQHLPPGKLHQHPFLSLSLPSGFCPDPCPLLPHPCWWAQLARAEVSVHLSPQCCWQCSPSPGASLADRAAEVLQKALQVIQNDCALLLYICKVILSRLSSECSFLSEFQFCFHSYCTKIH